jgi:hypothetical protein
MEKNSFDIRPMPYVRIDFRGNEVIIDPYISMENKGLLLKAYVDIIKDEEKSWADRYLLAEYLLMGSIIELNTNVNTTGVLTSNLENSDLWSMIKYHINNYEEFRNEIETVVKYVREDMQLKNSTNTSLNYLISQVSSFLDKISQIDVSKEGFESLAKALNQEKNEINKIVDPSKVVEKKPRKRKEAIQ